VIGIADGPSGRGVPQRIRISRNADQSAVRPDQEESEEREGKECGKAAGS